MHTDTHISRQKFRGAMINVPSDCATPWMEINYAEKIAMIQRRTHPLLDLHIFWKHHPICFPFIQDCLLASLSGVIQQHHHSLPHTAPLTILSLGNGSQTLLLSAALRYIFDIKPLHILLRSLTTTKESLHDDARIFTLSASSLVITKIVFMFFNPIFTLRPSEPLQYRDTFSLCVLGMIGRFYWY